MSIRFKPSRRQRVLSFEPLEGRQLLTGLASTAPLPPSSESAAQGAPVSLLASDYGIGYDPSGGPAVSSTFTASQASSHATSGAEGEAGPTPTVISPLGGTVLETTSVTLKLRRSPVTPASTSCDSRT